MEKHYNLSQPKTEDNFPGDVDNDPDVDEDEEEYEYTECKEDQFTCHSQTQCILAHQKCDGKKQCDDGSDERNCPAKGEIRPLCLLNLNIIYRCGDSLHR